MVFSVLEQSNAEEFNRDVDILTNEGQGPEKRSPTTPNVPTPFGTGSSQ
jgi:hypothetical protein